MMTQELYVVRQDNLKVGDKIQVDAGFTCIEAWAERVVKEDDKGELYIDCAEGTHYLDGQLSSFYVGIKKI